MIKHKTTEDKITDSRKSKKVVHVISEIQSGTLDFVVTLSISTIGQEKYSIASSIDTVFVIYRFV